MQCGGFSSLDRTPEGAKELSAKTGGGRAFSGSLLNWASNLGYNAHGKDETTYGELRADPIDRLVAVLLQDLPADQRLRLSLVDLGSGNCRTLRRLARAFIDNETALIRAVGVEEVRNLHDIAGAVLANPKSLIGTGLKRKDFVRIHAKVEDFTFEGHHIFFSFDTCFGSKVDQMISHHN
jgi:hypothetical protein